MVREGHPEQEALTGERVLASGELEPTWRPGIEQPGFQWQISRFGRPADQQFIPPGGCGPFCRGGLLFLAGSVAVWQTCKVLGRCK
jgi:hypothetical protein